jgi:hypothetical protein
VKENLYTEKNEVYIIYFFLINFFKTIVMESKKREDPNSTFISQNFNNGKNGENLDYICKGWLNSSSREFNTAAFKLVT